MNEIEEKLQSQLQKYKVDLKSKRYLSLTGRHKKLYRLRNNRLMIRMVRIKFPKLLAEELASVQPISICNSKALITRS